MSPSDPVPNCTDDAGPVRQQVEIASRRRRLASLMYEMLLLAGVLALLFMLPWLLIGMVTGFVPPGWLAWLHIVAAAGLYFLWYWRHLGQTLAMQTWRLRLVDAASGESPDINQCLRRYLLAWPSVCFLGVGLIWSLFDRDRQFLHDRLSGTCIVLLPTLKRPARHSGS